MSIIQHRFFLPPPLSTQLALLTGVCTWFLPLKLNRSVFFDLSIPREGTRCKSSGGVNAPIVPPIGRHYHLKRNSSIIFKAFWIFQYPVSGIRYIRYPAHSDIRQDNPDPVFTDRIYPVSGSGTKIESGKTLVYNICYFRKSTGITNTVFDIWTCRWVDFHFSNAVFKYFFTEWKA